MLAISCNSFHIFQLMLSTALEVTVDNLIEIAKESVFCNSMECLMSVLPKIQDNLTREDMANMLVNAVENKPEILSHLLSLWTDVNVIDSVSQLQCLTQSADSTV